MDDRRVSGAEPSREELLALVAAQARVIEEQADRIERLETLVVELQRRLSQNSRNSSKPPTSDGCPDCGGVLARWGHTALRFVRVLAGGVERVRLRRSICPKTTRVDGCGRSHVLLPRVLLGRRLDEVGVIWSVLVARAGGWGWRRAAGLAGRPASTVRGWLARFADRADAIRQGFAELEQLVSAASGGDMDRLVPAGGSLSDAVAQIGACLAALRRSPGLLVPVMSLCSAIR